jgi:hypothetical protein
MRSRLAGVIGRYSPVHETKHPFELFEGVLFYARPPRESLAIYFADYSPVWILLPTRNTLMEGVP